jgi:hypothetical protein
MNEQPASTTRAKRPWSTPTLREYGRVVAETQPRSALGSPGA